MKEIELKAHVHDRDSLLTMLNSFSRFDRIIIKDDEYLKLEKNCCNEGNSPCRITARIRTEEHKSYDNKSLGKKIFLTYKKKERRVDENGTSVEFNDELETELSDSDCVKTLLLDSGFEPYFTKHKDTMSFYADTPCGRAHLELCNVPPLGDFLEIEFVAEAPDPAAQKRMRSELEALIIKAGLSIEDIENKYYSELLKGSVIKITSV